MAFSEVQKMLDGRYTVQEKIGDGAAGQVFRAVPVSDPGAPPIAIKHMKNGRHGLRGLIEPFIMSTFRHPNILQATEIIYEAEQTAICMPLGTYDLYRARRRTPTADLSQLLTWCWQVCCAVACLHQHDILHGDIKSPNVLVMPDNSLCLTDFTLSLFLPESMHGHHTVCTITHRPPEVLLNLPWTRAVDLWALGCTLYEIVYGHSLFQYQDMNKAAAEEHTIAPKVLATYREWGYLHQVDFHKTYPDAHPHKLNKTRMKFFPLNLVFIQDAAHADINKLITALLHLDPTKRPAMPAVLHHPAFQFRQKLSAYAIRRPPLAIRGLLCPYEEANREGPAAILHTLPPPMQTLALAFWAALTITDPALLTPLRWACLILTIKMFHHVTYVPQSEMTPQIQQAEKWLCKHLQWHLPLP